MPKGANVLGELIKRFKALPWVLHVLMFVPACLLLAFVVLVVLLGPFERLSRWVLAGGSAVLSVCVGTFAYYFSRAAYSKRLKTLEKEYLSKPDYEDARDFEREKKRRRKKEEYEFRENLKKEIVLHSLRVDKLSFFDDFEWFFEPRINVLLGRNGYGKSHLMRAMVSLLYKDSDKAAEFFQDARVNSSIAVLLKRDQQDEVILHGESLFEKAIGKVPILAIPDLRFINKSITTVSLAETDEEGLKASGARHFLYQEPYEAVIQTFLYQLCFDYLDGSRSFELPIFRLIENIVQKLTDTGFAFHKITPIGNAQFKIEVLTEGNKSNPLPIQKASQGTLSILAVFGLIYNYLKSVFPDGSDDELLSKPAIVLIDEIDAHLHPSWQQKIVPLLRKNFPNIQFFVTAHSPLVVAGCLEGEVAVLRKKQNRFTVERFENDFIGSPPDEIYRRVFEVEDRDHSYCHYNALYPKKEDIQRQIQGFEREPKLTDREVLRLQQLRDDFYYLQKAREKQAERLEYKQLLRENDKLKRRLERLETLNHSEESAKDQQATTGRKRLKAKRRTPKKNE
jgi:AAA15 family ATPase/GTPase